MEEKTGFEIMDTALFILSHAIETNIDLQLLIIDLSKKVSSAAIIFKRVRPIWQHQKDTETVFWNKYPLFSKTSTSDLNLLLTSKDFQRFYSRVLQKILFKLAFHSMNAKPLVFTSSNLLQLINYAVVKKQTPQIQSLSSYITVVKYILQQNIAFQKLILELMWDQNYITSIEMRKFERFTGEENLELMNVISPFIQEYCNQSKERIFGYKTEKWKMPEQFMKMMYTGTPENFVHYLEDSIKKQAYSDMNEEQNYIYNKFIVHNKYAENHLEMQGGIIIQRQNERTEENGLRRARNNKRFRRREGSILGRLDINRKSNLHQMKSRTEYKKKSSLLNQKQMITLENTQRISTNSIMRVSTVKSRESILQSLHSFVDQYNVDEGNMSVPQMTIPFQESNIVIEQSPPVSLLKVSNPVSRASIEIQTSSLAFRGLPDPEGNKPNFKKYKMRSGEKQNMFSKLKYMRAIGHSLVPDERRSIKTIAKLINFQNERIPNYGEDENRLRKQLMSRILDLIGDRYDLSNVSFDKEYSLQEGRNSNKSRDNVDREGLQGNKKSRFASEAEPPQWLQTEGVEKRARVHRNYRSTSVREDLFGRSGSTNKDRSSNSVYVGRGYDIYDTRTRKIVHSNDR